MRLETIASRASSRVLGIKSASVDDEAAAPSCSPVGTWLSV